MSYESSMRKGCQLEQMQLARKPARPRVVITSKLVTMQITITNRWVALP